MTELEFKITEYRNVLLDISKDYFNENPVIVLTAMSEVFFQTVYVCSNEDIRKTRDGIMDSLRTFEKSLDK